jgi:c(7)-type cytochrome triheme protein
MNRSESLNSSENFSSGNAKDAGLLGGIRRAGLNARLKQLVVALFLICAAVLFVSSSLAQRGRQSRQPAPARPSQPAPAAAAQPQANKDKNKFTHDSHAQIKCDNCHIRKVDALVPSLPGHRACVSCHVKEFTSTAFGICSNCHKAIDAVRPALVDFPERESFGVAFSHTTHATYIGGERRADCSECHAVSGARATLPAHRECYACHKAPGEFKPGEKQIDGNCGVCHTNQGSFMKFNTGGAAYRYRFTHDSHLRAGAKCAECHGVMGEGSDQVSQPALREHRGVGFSKSCGSCHNGRRAFGGEVEHNACVRCHGRNPLA